MTKINRRGFLTSLAVTTACAGILTFPAHAEAIVLPDDIFRFDESTGQFRDYWFIKREYDPPKRPAIDFWSRQYSEVSYVDYLPREIPIGMLWYDSFGSTHVDNREALEYIDFVYRGHSFHRPNAVHQFAVHMDGIQTLAWTLRLAIGDDPSSPREYSRTALVALDSLGPSPRDPEWTGILPVFAQCYDRIIGHIHAPTRGLREWKARLDTLEGGNEESFFEHSVWNAASQCDVVIVTSSGLIETDQGLYAHTSPEKLGDLIRRFGSALLDREVYDRMLDTGRNGNGRKPRLFALGSATVTSPHHYSHDLDRTLNRQSRLVSDSFGDVIPDEMPLIVATAAENRRSEFLAGIDSSSGMRGKTIFKVPAPSYDMTATIVPSVGVLNLMTLWPFEFNESKLA